jgi:molybdopterin-binding protein
MRRGVAGSEVLRRPGTHPYRAFGVPQTRPREFELDQVLAKQAARILTMLSARNQFKGTIKSVKLGAVAAEVVIQIGNLEVVSMITRGSAEHLALKIGDEVKAIIKSTEVLIDK